MSILKRIKFFFQKRLPTFATILWDIKSVIKGNRKRRWAGYHNGGSIGIDLGGKQHVHIYPTLVCNLHCYFCQNSFYVDKLPKFNHLSWHYFADWLNRMYNFHHIDVQGGEPLLWPGIIDLLNNLHHHNIVIFTNLPKVRIHTLEQISTKTNNITLNVSYHPLEEKRDIAEFVDDFKKIPKRLLPSVHVIEIPEISYKNIRAAFASRGVFIEGLSAIVPTEHNKIKEPFKTVMCKSDMDCIAPDMKVYRCTGLMLRGIGGIPIEMYKFSNDHIKCDYYGLCGPCTAMKDVKNVEG